MIPIFIYKRERIIEKLLYEKNFVRCDGYIGGYDACRM